MSPPPSPLPPSRPFLPLRRHICALDSAAAVTTWGRSAQAGDKLYVAALRWFILHMCVFRCAFAVISWRRRDELQCFCQQQQQLPAPTLLPSGTKKTRPHFGMLLFSHARIIAIASNLPQVGRVRGADTISLIFFFFFFLLICQDSIDYFTPLTTSVRESGFLTCSQPVQHYSVFCSLHISQKVHDCCLVQNNGGW